MAEAHETCQATSEKYERPQVVTYGEHREDLDPGITCTWVVCGSTTNGHVISFTDP